MIDRNRFFTPVDAPDIFSKIAHDHSILCMGSCFAETMGSLLEEHLFRACINPFGILFNPASMSKSLQRLQSRKPYSEEDLFCADGLWESWDHHGSFAATSVTDSLNVINTRFIQGCEALAHCDVLVITFGTALTYEHSKTGAIVANCHKQPSSLFSRRMLSIEEIVADWSEVLTRLFTARPNCSCIATVSPVRHVKSGAHENLVCKSILVCALHELQKSFPRLFYFPSYEIMMDELRDYRFYGRDMVHPSDVAVDYLWDRFVESCVDENSKLFIREWESVRKAMHHHVSAHAAEATRNFTRAQLQTIGLLAKKYPEINFEKAVEYFQGLIAGHGTLSRHS
jgi:hypothetical protein